MTYSASNQWFRVWMPYQFLKLDLVGAKHIYLPLNRNYKPLGFGKPLGNSDHVNYLDYRRQAISFLRDPHSFKGVWYDVSGLYLYGDEEASQSTYFERLGLLMDRVVKLYGATDREEGAS